MISDLAQQLRDIHEPAAPGFWPFTISWWILFGLILLLLTILVVWYVRHSARLAPYKRIRKLARQLTDRRAAGEIDGLTYATSVNLLYKELLRDVENRTDSIVAFGAGWQELLFERFNNESFLSGPGQCLGTTRYSNVPFSDEGLSILVQNTLLRVKPAKAISND